MSNKAELAKAEFPDFDDDFAALLALLPEGWRDESWHNDTCPKLGNPAVPDFGLWIDYKNPELSEYADERMSGNAKRFNISRHLTGEILIETDDFAEIVAAITDGRLAAFAATFPPLD